MLKPASRFKYLTFGAPVMAGVVRVVIFVVGLPVVTAAEPMSLAAIEQSNPVEKQPETDIPWSKQVLEIQRALLDLGLYRGAVNGRLNAATEKAIRRFEVKFGRIGQGGLSPDGILNLSSVTNAVRIQRLLEKSRKDQVIRARSALTRNRETQDLVRNSDRWSSGSADIEYVTKCTPQTMTECSIAKALDEIAKIGRSDYRDWALRDAVRVIASLGAEKVGREVISKISDPRLILVSLREMAVGLARVGHMASATEVAYAIPDVRNKAKAFASLALIRFSNGERKAGDILLADMLEVLEDEKNTSNFVSMVTEVCRLLGRAGLQDVAGAMMPHVEERMRPLEGETQADAEWGMVATAYATLGDGENAERALKRIKNADTRKRLILPTAPIFTDDSAVQDESEKKKSPYRIRSLVVAMNNFAQVRQFAGDLDGAKQLVVRSAKFLEFLDRSYASDYTRAHFIDQALRVGLNRDAFEVVKTINRKGLKIKKKWGFVGGGDDAVSLEEAIADTELVSNLFQRCLIYLHASRVVAGKVSADEVLALIEKARALTEKLGEPWWRARALISLAAAYRAGAAVKKD